MIGMMWYDMIWYDITWHGMTWRHGWEGDRFLCLRNWFVDRLWSIDIPFLPFHAMTWYDMLWKPSKWQKPNFDFDGDARKLRRCFLVSVVLVFFNFGFGVFWLGLELEFGLELWWGSKGRMLALWWGCGDSILELWWCISGRCWSCEGVVVVFSRTK